MPYPCFRRSARCLDSRRLNKQIQEGIVVLKTLSDRTSGWKNHPCVKQWNGYEEALKLYVNCCIDEWLTRTKKNGECITSNQDKYQEVNYSGLVVPHWLGNKQYHVSHRSNLLRKDVTFYSQWGWTDDSILPYFWPA